MANSITVSQLNQQATSANSALLQNANAFLQDLMNVANSDYGGIKPHDGYLPNWVDPNLAASIDAAAANLPTEVAFPVDTSQRPVEPAFTSITIPQFGAVPEFTLVEPIIDLPAAPDSTMPTAPGNAPTVNTILLPTAPAIVLPAVPVIEALALPVVPAINIPLYNDVAPVDDMLDPTSTFEFDEQAYSSDLLDEAHQKLMADMVNGGYGIETSDELALWARARERELLNAEANIQDAARQVAARGSMIPPGAFNTLVRQAQEASFEKNSSLSRDIALKRADMYVENRKFTLQEVRETESMLIQYFNAVQERMLNAAKYTAEFGIQLFNARVQRFNARLEAQRGAALVFETQLHAALAHLDVYKAQVEGARLSVEVQQLYVSLYNSQLAGVQANVNLYRTEMEAAQIATELEMSKITMFRASVDAYTAQVGAKSAEFGMYQSQIRGEMAKVELYQSSVSAYGTRVAAYSSGVSANETIVRAQVAAAQLPLDQYRAKIQMYGADVSRYQTDVNAALGINDTRLRKYGINVDAVAKGVSERVQAGLANANISSSFAQIASSEALGSANAMNSRASIVANASSSGLSILSQNMAAAVGAAGGLVAEITSA